MTRAGSSMTNTRKAGVALATLTIAFPGLFAAGYLIPVQSGIGLAVLLLVALLGGAGSGLQLAWDEHRWLGLGAGLVAGPGGFLCTAAWGMWRESLWSLEMALTLLVGSAPGIALYLVGAWMLDQRKDRRG